MDQNDNLPHLNWKACEGLGALISTMVKLNDLLNVTYPRIDCKIPVKSRILNKSFFFLLRGFASFIYLFAENKIFY